MKITIAIVLLAMTTAASAQDATITERYTIERKITAPLPAPQGAVTYQVSPGVSNGILNVRAGPGVNHSLLTYMPAGALVPVTQCVPRDDGISGANWCEVVWNGIRGWASTAGMMPIR